MPQKARFSAFFKIVMENIKLGQGEVVEKLLDFTARFLCEPCTKHVQLHNMHCVGERLVQTFLRRAFEIWGFASPVV